MEYYVAVTVQVEANNPDHAKAIVKNALAGTDLEYDMLQEVIPSLHSGEN